MYIVTHPIVPYFFRVVVSLSISPECVARHPTPNT